MKTIEKEYVRLFDIGQSRDVIIGMTKTNITGENPPDDMRKALAYSGRQFDVAYMKQVHEADVKIIDRGGLYVCDGIFTKSKNIVLIVKTADCLPLVFINEKDGIVGVVHMGWRSAKDGILENIPYDLADFTVIAGVAMRRCCYAVGKEFADYPRIAPYLTKKDDQISRHETVYSHEAGMDGAGFAPAERKPQIAPKGASYFDPIRFAKDALVQKGLCAERFIDTNECSYCSPENYPAAKHSAVLKQGWTGRDLLHSNGNSELQAGERHHSHRRTKTTCRMLTFVGRWGGG